MQNLLQRNVSFVPKYYQYDKNSPQDGCLEGNGFVGELVASDEADVLITRQLQGLRRVRPLSSSRRIFRRFWCSRRST